MEPQLIPHLFRTEFSRMVAVLCKNFGLHNIQLAEDLVSDTFLKASETWGLKGVPENPKAWLYRVAKNKTYDHFRREKILHQKVLPELAEETQNSLNFDLDLSNKNIQDSQLQMMFAVCNPIIAKEAQISLALRILCGFGIDEIAGALLAKPATIKKRLLRAKETIRNKNLDLCFPPITELDKRLENVLSVLYLLFNEGYFATLSGKKIRKELCLEAMRLLHLLLEEPSLFKSEPNALMALFCFHASRFDARENDWGEQILYEDQDQSSWNEALILKGEQYLHISTNFQENSKYYLEALIAYWHTRKEVNKKEKWENILYCYNQLILIEYSPIAALNRTYALSKVYGKQKAINEALKIDLKQNPLYYALLSELYADLDTQTQVEYLKKAIVLTTSDNDRQVLEKKMRNLL